MEHRTFDSLTKALAQGRSRRSLLKGMFGIGTAAVSGAVLNRDADAARRGYSGPFPKPTVVAGPPTCNDQNCYGCHQCIDGICTDNPKENCYDHTNECLTSVCNSDGGCSYPFDCRVKEGCCGFDQYCDPSTGACMNCPGNLCQSSPAGPVCCSGATPNCCDQNGTMTCVAADVCCSDANCPGCQGCENGTCVGKSENCYDHTAECLASVCDADGGCSYPFDCRVKTGCCTGNETCNTSTGQCEAAT